MHAPAPQSAPKSRNVYIGYVMYNMYKSESSLYCYARLSVRKADFINERRRNHSNSVSRVTTPVRNPVSPRKRTTLSFFFYYHRPWTRERTRPDMGFCSDSLSFKPTNQFCRHNHTRALICRRPPGKEEVSRREQL